MAGQTSDGGGHVGEPGGLETRDRDVLRLLHEGLTDAAIARRLGTSERTIGRCVRSLMDRVGASTRFQLGWQAAARGWLTGGGHREPEPEPLSGRR